MRIGVWVSLAWIPCGLLYPLMPNVYLAAAFMVPPAFIGAMTIGVQAAAIQEIMPNTLRGRASAIFIFFNALIGLGLGPGALGLATDLLFQDEMKINYSIVLVGLLRASDGGVISLCGYEALSEDDGRVGRMDVGRGSGACWVEVRSRAVSIDTDSGTDIVTQQGIDGSPDRGCRRR